MPIVVQRYAESSDPVVVNALLYGASGSWKTQAAATFPHPLFLDADDGMVGVTNKDVMRVDLTHDQAWDQALEFYVNSAKVLESVPEARTLVIDDLTSLYARCVQYACRKFAKPSPTLNEYGFASDAMRNLILNLKDDCRKRRLHFVCTAQEQTIKDEVLGRAKGVPDVARKLGEELGALFDFYIHCVVTYDQVKKESQRIWWTVADGIYNAKDRLGRLPPNGPAGFESLRRVIPNIQT
jgi:hypothetical protein